MTDTVEVLVVGAGLGGLSAAMFLAKRGESGASLIRPDGIAAWRTASPVPESLPAVLDKLQVRQLLESAGPNR